MSPEKNCQMSIKVAQKWINYKNDRFWHPYKMPRIVWDLGKLIDAKGFKNLPNLQYIAQSAHSDSVGERKGGERDGEK